MSRSKVGAEEKGNSKMKRTEISQLSEIPVERKACHIEMSTKDDSQTREKMFLYHLYVTVKNKSEQVLARLYAWQGKLVRMLQNTSTFYLP